MNYVPLKIANKGRSVIDEYISINNEINQIKIQYKPLEDEYKDLLKRVHRITDFDVHNNYHYISLPYFGECEGKYDPEFNRMNTIADEMWTVQSKLGKIISEMATLSYKYKDLHYRLKELNR